MSRLNLSETEREMWAATSAHFQPADTPKERASMRGSMLILGLGVAVFTMALAAAVVVAVRYLVQRGGQL